MKTLAIMGSARPNGRTSGMLDLLLKQLEGEYEIINAYKAHINPCTDDRYCWKKRGCSLKDGMQEIYRKIDEADNIILASPMYFYSVPGPMKIIIDRLQMFWAGRLRNDKPKGFIKKGVILMVGGAPAFEKQFLAGEIVLKAVLGDLSARCIGMVTFSNTDKENPVDSDVVKTSIKEIAAILNSKNNV